MRWDLGRFGIERRCDCRDRSAECRGGAGWHLVDSADDRGAAIHSRKEIVAMSGAAHRVIDTKTGEVIA